MNTKHFFNKTELQNMLEFLDKYPEAMCVEVVVEAGNGIGRLVTAEVMITLNGDWVRVIKTITDQTSW